MVGFLYLKVLNILVQLGDFGNWVDGFLDSPAIHCTIHRAQFTAVTIHRRHNSSPAQFTAAQFIAGTIHRAQFTAYN
jgi:hypothetical protein